MGEVDPWFDHLYKRHAQNMVKTAAALLNDRSVAEELVHDVFVILLMKRADVETYQYPGAWLYRTLQNRISSELQRARYRKELPLDDNYEHYAAVHEEPDKLEDFLPSDLTSEERQFLIWYYEDDLTHEEISRRLGISVHASHARLYRLKQKCFKILSKNK